MSLLNQFAAAKPLDAQNDTVFQRLAGQKSSLPWSPQCPLQQSTEEHKCYNVTMMQNDLIDNEPGHLSDDESHGYQEGDHTLDLQYPTRQGKIIIMCTFPY